MLFTHYGNPRKLKEHVIKIFNEELSNDQMCSTCLAEPYKTISIVSKTALRKKNLRNCSGKKEAWKKPNYNKANLFIGLTSFVGLILVNS